MTVYQITCDGVVIHDSRLDNLRVSEPSADFTVGGTGKLEFALYPGSEHYDAIQKLKSEVTLWIDGEWAFGGRVLNDAADVLNIKRVEVEGDLGYFNDSVVRPYAHNGSVSDYLSKLVTDHNAQMPPERRFTLGEVTVSGEAVDRVSTSYPSTWEEFTEKLSGNLGGYFRTRRGAGGVRYLDYLNDYGNVNDQVIRFGENLIEMEKYIRGDEVVTALLPLGAQAGGGGERLTIADANGGKDYIYDEATVNLFGWVYKAVIFDTEGTAEALLERGRKYLADMRLLQVTLEVNALDLSLIDVDLERIKVGDLVRVVSAPHDVDDMMEVTELHLDLENPAESSMKLGGTRRTLTDQTTTAATLAPILDAYAKTEIVNQKLDGVVTSAEQVIADAINASTESILGRVSADYETKAAHQSSLDSFRASLSPTWVSAVTGNSWVNSGGGRAPARHAKDDTGEVHLGGRIQGGASGSVAFVLPSTSAPSHDLALIGFASDGTADGGTACRVDVLATGAVIPYRGSGTGWVSLDNISFRSSL